jgi:uncharacterized protein involved in outer membrane biogenesis
VNSLLLTLTALLILVLSALFAAPLFIDWNDYRSVFETQATKLLGRDVKVGGKVHLILLPAPELKFDDIKVADQDGRLDRPFLEAHSLEAWLNIGALLRGTIEARKLVIVSPVLRLDLKADGTGNWSDVGRRGVALPFAPKDVMLDEVSVSGGRIEIAKQGQPQFAVENVAGQASSQSLSGPYKVSAAYTFKGRPQELRFSTSAPDADGLFRIKSALRDLDRHTSYVVDGGMTGLGVIPTFAGTIVVRAANVLAADEEEDTAGTGNGEPSTAASRDKTSRFELKGPIKATPDRAELPQFDLTVHANGHPQIFKGNLTVDLRDGIDGAAELAASFIDLDALFAAPGAAERPSPSAVLYLFAEEVLGQAAEFGDGRLGLAIEQAGLGGDLVGAIDMAIASKDGAVAIERLKATLPGDNRIEASGSLKRGNFGPLFAGPVKVEGAGLQPLTRWAAGDRTVSGQASSGDFSFTADAVVGDGALKLANASGELSGTKFRGGLSLQGGERRLIEIDLDSDRLDLREVIGERPVWQAWLPGARTESATIGPNKGVAGTDEPAATASVDAAATGQDLFKQLRGDDMRVTLRVGELLLPDIPAGKLDARFGLQGGTLEVEQLDFAAAGALSLKGAGRIERLDQAPSGRVDFSLRAADRPSLRIAAGLLGLPESVSSSEHLSVLAPLDLNVSLVTAREGEATNASIALGGKAGSSDIAVTARAFGDLAKPGEAKIDLDGKVIGEKPQALLVLLFPDLPLERIVTQAASKGRLIVKLAGVPNTGMTGKAALETEPIEVAFVGQGSLQPSGLALGGKGAVVSRDASAALTLLGFEAPPSAASVPLTLRFDVAKQGAKIDLNGITGSIAGETVAGSVQLDRSAPKTRFSLNGNAGSLSFPSLLGVLVAWHRTPSTEEMLGTISTNTSEVWPLRGFSLGPLENFEGEIALKAGMLTLGSAVEVQDATLAASLGKEGLAVTELKGRLYGGAFDASGNLAPRGNGAELKARAEVKGGKLGEFAKSVTGTSLARGSFDLAFDVQGEGLSPPGVVAGLSGQGALVLGPGSLQSLSASPLRNVAATAARKTIKADKEAIEAETKSVREKITKGTYKFAPATLPFEIKNGTLTFAPATLTTQGAETKINGFVELASLKLDSEWALALTGSAVKDVPPVSLVFSGPLTRAGEIAPAIDTGAIEAYLTMRRMQEDVERLETLDVSGRTESAAAEGDGTDVTLPDQVPLESAASAEPELVDPSDWTAETDAPAPQKPAPSPSTASATNLPSALELLGATEDDEPVTPAAAKPQALPGMVTPKAPSSVNAAGTPEPATEPAPQSAPQPAPAPAEAATASPELESSPPAAEPAKPPRKRSASKPRRKPEAPDSWRQSVPMLGGG